MPPRHSSRHPLLSRRAIATACLAPLLLVACDCEDAASPQELAQEIITRAGVIRVTASGSGCPRGTWRARVSDDRMRVAVLFQSFTVGSAASGKACDVAISLSGADGYAFAPAVVTSRGAIPTERRTEGEASLATRIAWTDSTGETVATVARDAFDETQALSEQWSPCMGTRLLRVRPELTGQSGAATLREQEIVFVSKRCVDEIPDASVRHPEASDAATSADSQDQRLGPRLLADGSCSDATAAYEREGLSITLPAHTVVVPEGRAFGNRNCTLQFDRVFQPGRSYAIESYVVEGTASLPLNSTGTVRSIPYVFGSGWSRRADDSVVRGELELAGPRETTFRSEVNFSDAELQYAECSGTPLLGLDLLASIVDVETRRGGALSITKVSAIKFKARACEP